MTHILSFRQHFLREGFFADEEIEHAYRVACSLARQGEPLNRIRQSIRDFVSDFADADPEEVEAFTEKVMKMVLEQPQCSPLNR